MMRARVRDVPWWRMMVSVCLSWRLVALWPRMERSCLVSEMSRVEV